MDALRVPALASAVGLRASGAGLISPAFLS